MGEMEGSGAERVDLRDPRVLVADHHRLFAEALGSAFRRLGWRALEATGEVTRERLLDLAEAVRPHIVLLDLDYGPNLLAPEVVPELMALGAWVLAVTDGHDRPLLAEALEAGVSGVIDKKDSLERVVQLIRDTVAGMAIFPQSVRSELLTELADLRAEQRARMAPFNRLTRREGQVLALLMMGKTPAEIAVARYVSVTTIRTQIQSVLRKLGVNSQLAAVALARELGWTPVNVMSFDDVAAGNG